MRESRTLHAVEHYKSVKMSELNMCIMSRMAFTKRTYGEWCKIEKVNLLRILKHAIVLVLNAAEKDAYT